MKGGGKAKGKAPKKKPPAGPKKKPGKTGRPATAVAKAKKRTPVQRAPAAKIKQRPPQKNATAGGKKKTKVKPPGPPPAPKPAVKPKGVTNCGAWPISIPMKKANKVQAEGVLPRALQNTAQTSAKKRAPKRKLNPPKAATPISKKPKIGNPAGMHYEDKRHMQFNVVNRVQHNPVPYFSGQSSYRHPEISYEDKRPIHINVVNPVQPNPGPSYSGQSNYQQQRRYEDKYQMEEDTVSQAQPNPGPSSKNPQSLEQNSYYQEILLRFRKGLINSCNITHVNALRDDLRHENVLTDSEVEIIKEANNETREKIRELCDIVRKKGDRACKVLLQKLYEMDKPLCTNLGITDLFQNTDELGERTIDPTLV